MNAFVPPPEIRKTISPLVKRVFPDKLSYDDPIVAIIMFQDKRINFMRKSGEKNNIETKD